MSIAGNGPIRNRGSRGEGRRRGAQLVAPNSTPCGGIHRTCLRLSDDPVVVSVDVPRRLRPDVVTSEGVDDFNTEPSWFDERTHVAGRRPNRFGHQRRDVDVGFAQLLAGRDRRTTAA